MMYAPVSELARAKVRLDLARQHHTLPEDLGGILSRIDGLLRHLLSLDTAWAFISAREALPQEVEQLLFTHAQSAGLDLNGHAPGAVAACCMQLMQSVPGGLLSPSMCSRLQACLASRGKGLHTDTLRIHLGTVTSPAIHGLRGELLSRLMTKVAADLASCGQPDALRRSFVLAIAPALCLDASRATQRKATEMLLWAHEQLVQAETGAAAAPQRHRPAGDSGRGSLIAQQGLKQRPALATADTNIGVTKDYRPPVEAQNLKAMPAEEEWHIHAIYGRESENVETAADAPQLLTERGQRAMQRLAGIQGPVGQWAASSCLGTSERHLSRATSASSASLHASTLHACRGSAPGSRGSTQGPRGVEGREVSTAILQKPQSKERVALYTAQEKTKYQRPGWRPPGRLPAHQEAKRPSATVVMPYHAKRKTGRSITDPLRSSIPQAPAAWEHPAAIQQDVRQHAVDPQILSVEREQGDAPQQAHSWRLEEPADELSMSPGQQRPEQASAARAAHSVGHHASSHHAMEGPWQLQAGDSRPDSHGGAWPGMQLGSQGSSGAASSALWLDAAAPRNQSSLCLPHEGEQHLREILPTANQFLDDGSGTHAEDCISSGGSDKPVAGTASDDGLQPAKLRQGISSAAAKACTLAVSSHDADQSEGSDLLASQDAVPQLQRHAGSAAGLGDSTLPVSLPDASSGRVSDWCVLKAAHITQESTLACDSSGTEPIREFEAAQPAGTGTHDSRPTILHDSMLSRGDGSQSSGPHSRGPAVASMKGMLPDQAHSVGSSTAAQPAMLPSATGQHGAHHGSSTGLQPGSECDQDGVNLGCFAEQCGAAMQVSGAKGSAAGRPGSTALLDRAPAAASGSLQEEASDSGQDGVSLGCSMEQSGAAMQVSRAQPSAVGRPGSATSLERRAIAASSSLQEVAESRSVWMQLSAVFSEADSILEDASGSCEGSVSSCPSHRHLADDNSSSSGQSSAHVDAVPAFSSGRPENAGCSSLPGCALPTGDSAGQTYSNDASHSGRASRANPNSGQGSANADAGAALNSCQPESAISRDMQGSMLAAGEQALSAQQSNTSHDVSAPEAEHDGTVHGGTNLPAQAASSAIAAAGPLEGGTEHLHGAMDAPAPHDSQPGPRSSGIRDGVRSDGLEQVTGAARQGDVGHLNIAAYHPNRSPQAVAHGGSTHLRSPLRADMVGRSPQEKALHASAHLRTPPASAKKALRFPSPTRVPALGRHGQAQQAAAAAAQATSRVISGFGQVAARLGMSGFFGGAPAGSKPAGTQKAHTAAVTDVSLRTDARLGVSSEKAKGVPQDGSGSKGASVSQRPLLKASAAAHEAVSDRPGQVSNGGREPETLLSHAPAQRSGLGFANDQQSSASLRASSAHANGGAAGSNQASLSQDKQRRNASALLIGPEKAHQAGTNTEGLASIPAGTGQVKGQHEGTSPPSDEGAAAESVHIATPGMLLDTGEHAVSKVVTFSLSSAQSGHHLISSAPIDEPSSISDHAVSEMSGESAGDREHADSSWPAGTAQHSMAASKARHARCDELRSSGGSVGSYCTESDLSNSQHDSYQGSYPSRPESSGTHGTLDAWKRDGQSISVPADMAAVLRSLQLGLKGEAASSSQGLSSEDDQARVRGFLQELSQKPPEEAVVLLQNALAQAGRPEPAGAAAEPSAAPKKATAPPPPLPPPPTKAPAAMGGPSTAPDQAPAAHAPPPPPPPPPKKAPARKAPPPPPPPPPPRNAPAGKVPPPPPPPPPKKAPAGKGPPPPPPMPPKKTPAGKGAPPPPPLPPKSGAKGAPKPPVGTPPPPPPPSRGPTPGKSAQKSLPSTPGIAKVKSRRLKQLHWDKIKTPQQGTVWAKDQPQVNLNLIELENLFQIMENKAMKKLVKVRNEEILLIEHRRAHNICIELAGVRMPFPDIKEALWRMDDSRLSVEQLTALSRAVPEEQERRDIGLFLKGEHPKHQGVSDAGLLGTVERYFAEIMPIPRLQQRIDCFIFTRSFEPAMQRVRGQLEVLMSASEELMACGDFMILLRAVLTLGNHLNEGTMRGSASGFKLDTLLKLADVKGTDRKTSLLHFVLEQLLKEENASVGTLSTQLKSIHPAANLQVSAIKQGIAELRAGLKKAEAEINMAADLVGADEGAALMAQFANMMAAFHTSAAAAVARTEEHEASVYGSMKSVTAYFGEDWDANDPSRVLRVIRDFMNLFNKAQHEIEAKKLKDEEERSKEQRRASLAASRRPSISAPGGAPSAAGEAATPSGAQKGDTVMSPAQCESEMQTPTSQLMPYSAQMGTPAESVGSVWVPDAVSVSRAPVRDDWPSNGFGRVLDEPQKQRSPRASLAEHTLGSRHPCRLSSGNAAQDAPLGSAGCADADVTLEVVASREAAADACLALERDGNIRAAKEASSAREQQTPAKPGSSQQQDLQDTASREDQQSVENKHMPRPIGPLDVRAASVAGGGSQEASSAGSSPCSSQQTYADAGSNAMFTPVPLVDRLPVGARSSLRLEQLPCPSPLPASCPATPAGQRRQAMPDESTPVLFGRPASAGAGSARRAPYLEGSGWTPPPTVLVDSQRYFTPGFKRMFTPAGSPSGSPSL